MYVFFWFVEFRGGGRWEFGGFNHFQFDIYHACFKNPEPRGRELHDSCWEILANIIMYLDCLMNDQEDVFVEVMHFLVYIV